MPILHFFFTRLKIKCHLQLNLTRVNVDRRLRALTDVHSVLLKADRAGVIYVHCMYVIDRQFSEHKFQVNFFSIKEVLGNRTYFVVRVLTSVQQHY